MRLCSLTDTPFAHLIGDHYHGTDYITIAFGKLLYLTCGASEVRDLQELVDDPSASFINRCMHGSL